MPQRTAPPPRPPNRSKDTRARRISKGAPSQYESKTAKLTACPPGELSSGSLKCCESTETGDVLGAFQRPRLTNESLFPGAVRELDASHS